MEHTPPFGPPPTPPFYYPPAPLHWHIDPVATPNAFVSPLPPYIYHVNHLPTPTSSYHANYSPTSSTRATMSYWGQPYLTYHRRYTIACTSHPRPLHIRPACWSIKLRSLGRCPCETTLSIPEASRLNAMVSVPTVTCRPVRWPLWRSSRVHSLYVSPLSDVKTHMQSMQSRRCTALFQR